VPYPEDCNKTPALTTLDSGLCCEVAIIWGTTVLHVCHLAPPRAFTVGEAPSNRTPCDFLIPAQALGTERLPLLVKSGSSIAISLPRHATGAVKLPGEPVRSLPAVEQLDEANAGSDSGTLIPLPLGASVWVKLHQFTFQVTMGRASKAMRHGIQRTELALLGYIALSLTAIGGCLGTMSLCAPPMGLTEDESLDAEPYFLVQQYLEAASERERGKKPTDHSAEETVNNEGGTGTRTIGEEGSLGNELTRVTNRRYAVPGAAASLDARLARSARLREAQAFGMIGLLNAEELSDSHSVYSLWSKDMVVGADPLRARANLWGHELGDARGSTGLGLSGIGEGGGGRGEGIGLGNIGTLGHGAANGTGEGFGNGSGGLYGCGCGNGVGNGLGSGWGRVGGAHKAKSPKMRLGRFEVAGHLPPEMIQRIVREHDKQLRQCYERGLMTNPNLQGSVSVRFVIGRDGSVSNVRNGGSSVPDSAVVGCVMRAYYGLSFPEPAGGIVTVVHPIQFEPG